MTEKPEKNTELVILLDTCAPEKMGLIEEDRAWLSMLPVGREVIDDEAD